MGGESGESTETEDMVGPGKRQVVRETDRERVVRGEKYELIPETTISISKGTIIYTERKSNIISSVFENAYR